MRPALLVGALLVGASLVPLRARADMDVAPQPSAMNPASELRGEARRLAERIEALLSDWDVEGAAEALARLDVAAPDERQARAFFRGRIAFELGRYDEALSALEAAGLAKGPGSWLQLARDTKRIVGAHERTESEHFVLFTPPGKDRLLAGWALEALERARTAMLELLDYAPPGKVRVEVVSSAAELAATSTLSRDAIKTTGTIAICKFNKLIVTSPKAVLRGYEWIDTLVHEYAHLVVSRKSRNTVPIWLHEGVAKYLESVWRAPPGHSMSPSSLALLGARVRTGTLVPFEKMHPSMALLPNAEDAATAFAEVFFAVRLVSERGGPQALRRLLEALRDGSDDRRAVELVTRLRWPDFEREWMSFLKRQPFPQEAIPRSVHERRRLLDGEASASDAPATGKSREVRFLDFAEVSELEARRAAHLGELLRERGRMRAAVEHFERAARVVGSRYESVNNKLALSLAEVGRVPEALDVLERSLTKHPGSPETNVHLGRYALLLDNPARAKRAALDAVAVNPFDPEVHLILFSAATRLRDEPLARRSAQALTALMRVDEHAVPAAAQEYLEREARRSAPRGAGSTPDAGSSPPVESPDPQGQLPTFQVRVRTKDAG